MAARLQNQKKKGLLAKACRAHLRPYSIDKVAHEADLSRTIDREDGWNEGSVGLYATTTVM